MNIKLKIQYDGTEYHGWQMQAGDATVQEKLTEAARRITGGEVKLKGCGRSDAGVHAEEYVCNFHTDARIPVDRYPYALNSKLPKDIVCLGAELAEEDFDSNKSAKAKRYIYRIYNSDIPDAFWGRY